MPGSSAIRATYMGSYDVDDNRTHGERVKAAIIATGIRLWHVNPAHVTARRIAREHGVTHAAVLYHFGNAEGLRNAIADAAVSCGDRVIVPQLITAKHPAAAALSEADRRQYLAGC
jgi:AcrR family transcriptional regulator